MERLLVSSIKGKADDMVYAPYYEENGFAFGSVPLVGKAGRDKGMGGSRREDLCCAKVGCLYSRQRLNASSRNFVNSFGAGINEVDLKPP